MAFEATRTFKIDGPRVQLPLFKDQPAEVLFPHREGLHNFDQCVTVALRALEQYMRTYTQKAEELYRASSMHTASSSLIAEFEAVQKTLPPLHEEEIESSELSPTMFQRFDLLKRVLNLIREEQGQYQQFQMTGIVEIQSLVDQLDDVLAKRESADQTRQITTELQLKLILPKLAEKLQALKSRSDSVSVFCVQAIEARIEKCKKITTCVTPVLTHQEPGGQRPRALSAGRKKELPSAVPEPAPMPVSFSQRQGIPVSRMRANSASGKKESSASLAISELSTRFQALHISKPAPEELSPSKFHQITHRISTIDKEMLNLFVECGSTDIGPVICKLEDELEGIKAALCGPSKNIPFGDHVLCRVSLDIMKLRLHRLSLMYSPELMGIRQGIQEITANILDFRASKNANIRSLFAACSAFQALSQEFKRKTDEVASRVSQQDLVSVFSQVTRQYHQIYDQLAICLTSIEPQKSECFAANTMVVQDLRFDEEACYQFITKAVTSLCFAPWKGQESIALQALLDCCIHRLEFYPRLKERVSAILKMAGPYLSTTIEWNSYIALALLHIDALRQVQKIADPFEAAQAQIKLERNIKDFLQELNGQSFHIGVILRWAIESIKNGHFFQSTERDIPRTALVKAIMRALYHPIETERMKANGMATDILNKSEALVHEKSLAHVINEFRFHTLRNIVSKYPRIQSLAADVQGAVKQRAPAWLLSKQILAPEDVGVQIIGSFAEKNWPTLRKLQGLKAQLEMYSESHSRSFDAALQAFSDFQNLVEEAAGQYKTEIESCYLLLQKWVKEAGLLTGNKRDLAERVLELDDDFLYNPPGILSKSRLAFVKLFNGDDTKDISRMRGILVPLLLEEALAIPTNQALIKELPALIAKLARKPQFLEDMISDQSLLDLIVLFMVNRSGIKERLVFSKNDVASWGPVVEKVKKSATTLGIEYPWGVFPRICECWITKRFKPRILELTQMQAIRKRLVDVSKVGLSVTDYRIFREVLKTYKSNVKSGCEVLRPLFPSMSEDALADLVQPDESMKAHNDAVQKLPLFPEFMEVVRRGRAAIEEGITTVLQVHAESEEKVVQLLQGKELMARVLSCIPPVDPDVQNLCRLRIFDTTVEENEISLLQKDSSIQDSPIKIEEYYRKLLRLYVRLLIHYSGPLYKTDEAAALEGKLGNPMFRLDREQPLVPFPRLECSEPLRKEGAFSTFSSSKGPIFALFGYIKSLKELPSVYSRMMLRPKGEKTVEPALEHSIQELMGVVKCKKEEFEKASTRTSLAPLQYHFDAVVRELHAYETGLKESKGHGIPAMVESVCSLNLRDICNSLLVVYEAAGLKSSVPLVETLDWKMRVSKAFMHLLAGLKSVLRECGEPDFRRQLLERYDYVEMVFAKCGGA